MTYHATTGVIESKTGNSAYNLGTYAYKENGSTKPHAVTSVENNNGIISHETQDIQYNVFNKVYQISEGQPGNEKVLDIMYGPGQGRKKVSYSLDGNLQYTQYYSGILEETINGQTGNSRKVYYLNGGTALYIIDETDNANFYYPHTDYLGNIECITDQNRNRVMETAFDPWGNRRNPSTHAPRSL